MYTSGRGPGSAAGGVRASPPHPAIIATASTAATLHVMPCRMPSG
jgi:hypothetical protein